MGDVADALLLLQDPVDWVICGKDQGYLSGIQSRLNKSGSNHRVIYLGPLTQEALVLQLQWSDVFVFPSWDEGLGKSLLEAMGCGLPVIVSDIEAFRGLVNDGQNGTVVTVRSPPSIAAALSAYLQMGDLRVSHGHNARHTIETSFTREKELDAWSAVIEGGTY